MMGRQHAKVNAAAGVGVLPFLVPGLSPVEWVGGTVLAVGAGLFNDWDQGPRVERGRLRHTSTVSAAYGPAGMAVGETVGACLGGHRAGTHSLLTTGALAVALPHVAGGLVGRAVLCAAMLPPVVTVVADRRGGEGMVVDGRRLAARLTLGARLLAAALLGVVLALVMSPRAVVVSVLVGWVAHIVGDVLTAGGAALLWPLRRDRFEVPVLGHTSEMGRGREWLISAGSAAFAVGMLGWFLLGG